MKTHRRVVVTGIGMVTCLGNDVDTTWNRIKNGESGIGAIEGMDCSAFATKIAGEIRDFDVGRYIPPKEARRLDPFIHYGAAAGKQALEDSGLLPVSEALAPRFGTAVGSGIGGLGTIEDTRHVLDKSGPRRVSPFVVPASIVNMVAGLLSIEHKLAGPSIAIATACTSGTHNIGMAARLIAYGDADVMLAGGAEAALTDVGLAGFSAARALSTRNDDPKAASRPWDKDRDGFVLSNGAGMMILEEFEHAKARGATIYGEVSGFGMSSDAHHLTAPPEGGEGAEQAMRAALADAELDPSEVGYVNAHGTSTVAGDLAESRAVERLWGAHAESVAVSSTKSMVGHLVGAAGAVEAIFSLLAMRDGVAPPTINLDNPSEGCNLNYVPHTAQEITIKHALSNSFGFGGTNGSLVLSAL